jgi:hypothetical protein
MLFVAHSAPGRRWALRNRSLGYAAHFGLSWRGPHVMVAEVGFIMLVLLAPCCTLQVCCEGYC